jgi:hypothetical protein
MSNPDWNGQNLSKAPPIAGGRGASGPHSARRSRWSGYSCAWPDPQREHRRPLHLQLITRRASEPPGLSDVHIHIGRHPNGVMPSRYLTRRVLGTPTAEATVLHALRTWMYPKPPAWHQCATCRRFVD